MKRNVYFKSVLITMGLMVSSMFFLACSSDDGDGNEDKTIVSDKDPDGTIVVNMNNGSRDNYVSIPYYVHIDEANNFVGEYSNVKFASVGQVSGLSKITKIPSDGWSSSIAVVPGTGYLMLFSGCDLSSYRSEYQITRIYVVDYIVGTSGGIIGATIKYQYPFDTPIVLKNTSVTASFNSSIDERMVQLESPASLVLKTNQTGPTL